MSKIDWRRPQEGRAGSDSCEIGHAPRCILVIFALLLSQEKVLHGVTPLPRAAALVVEELDISVLERERMQTDAHTIASRCAQARV